MTRTCAATGCDRPVERPPGRRGRPPIYCSPACRKARRAPATRSRLVLELDHEPTDPGARPTGRVWRVQLRRDEQVVVLGAGLGWATARALGSDLEELLGVSLQEGGAIE